MAQMMNDENKKYRSADILNYSALRKFAAENRRNMTPAEKALWQQLRGQQLGVKFLRQYIIGNYIVDFFCPSKQLIIEVDGKYHYAEDNQDFDNIRDTYLSLQGYKVLRFINEQVLCNIDQVIATIQTQLCNLPPLKGE